ncbi:hypothetical protein GCM10029978_112060 [Actinoallomurus acanthiterrae]
MDGPAVSVDAPSGLPGLIRSRYAETRDRVVCADGELSFTGRELELASDAIAAALREVIREPGPVLVPSRRSVWAAAVLLGILKAGCAYVPVDPDEPAARIAAMVRRVAPVATVADEVGRLPGDHELPTVEIPLAFDRDADPASLAPVPPGRPVYVIFTSGSTGEPKGVVLGSEALCSRLRWMQGRYPLDARDRVLQKTPFTFDPSGWEVFWPLIAGARCEFAPPGAHRDPERLAAIMAEREITVCHFVPSMLAEMLNGTACGGVRTLRHIFCSGEALTAPVARRALDRWPGAALHNLYGPTEAAIDVTYWDVPADLTASDPVPIGFPVDNTRLGVMDRDGRPVAAGEPGELWIAGVQLALGYAGRPELTAAAFPTVAGERWYRTGDRVRRTEDGLLYLGRLDEQVKIGGVRVEPLETERVLGELTGGAAVVAVPGSAGPVLVAALSAEATVSDDRVRGHLTERLPAAFRPSAVYRLDRFPVTSSGKLDRRRLVEQAHRWWSGRAACAATGDAVGRAWAEALDLTGPVDETTGFLSAGGTSLRAIRLLAAIRAEFGVEIPLSRLLDRNISLAGLRESCPPGRPTPTDQPTPTDLPAADAEPTPARPPAAPAGSPRRSPLAPEQRRLWLLGQVHDDPAAYNVVAALRLTGEVDIEALGCAVRAMADRHDVLRARITEDATLVYDAAAPIEVAVAETAGILSDEAVDGFVREAGSTVIDDGRAPMARVSLLRSTAEPRSCLVLVLNHLIADQRTVDILLERLGADYSQAVSGAHPELRPADRYADYARSAARQVGNSRWTADLDHWRRRLTGAPPELALPFRRPSAVRSGTAGAPVTERLGAAFTDRLTDYLRGRAATPATFFLAVLGHILSAWTAQRTVLVGVPSSRRRTEAEFNTAGFFVESLPIRLDLDGLRTFGDLLAHSRSRFTEAMDHSAVTFDTIVDAVRPPRVLGRNPIFQVWLNDLTDAAPPPHLAGLVTEDVTGPPRSALFDLNLYLSRGANGLSLHLIGAADRCPDEVTAEILAQCTSVARQILAAPDIDLAAIDLVTDRAAARLPRPDETVPEAGERRAVTADVAAVAAAAPDAVAVVGPAEGETLSYGDLWRRAREVAGGLRRAGVGSGDTVVVRAVRSPGLPIALLAGWLAGARVALVDDALPAVRKAASERSLAPRLTVSLTGPAGPGTVSLADLQGPGAPAADEAAAGGPSHVLFTSGSTGDPVPVAVGHGPLRDFLRWYRASFGIETTDRFALVAGPAHDPILRDMFAPLIAGARLYVPPREITADPGLLAEWLAGSGITVLHATPALMELLLSGARSGLRLDALRLLVLGGAPLDGRLVRRLRAVTDAEIVNAYGTTETPQLVSCHRLPSDAPVTGDGQVPVGAGCAGGRLLVMTETGRPAGIGQRGEVVVRSRNLAEGLLVADARPDGFQADPQPGVRKFRTGDLGRYDPSGLVVLDGRKDRQVSIGGHRLDLGEVEAMTRRHPAVRDAIAVLEDRQGIEVLTLQATAGSPIGEDELRTFLIGRLPAHAVPVSISVVGNFILGVTHKARPRAVIQGQRVPGVRTGTSHPAVPRMAEAAAAVIGRPLGPGENFFEAGLNSMTLLELYRRSTAGLAWSFPVTALFAYPNLDALARHLAGDADTGSAVPPDAVRAGANRRPSRGAACAGRSGKRGRASEHGGARVHPSRREGRTSTAVRFVYRE